MQLMKICSSPESEMSKKKHGDKSARFVGVFYLTKRLNSKLGMLDANVEITVSDTFPYYVLDVTNLPDDTSEKKGISEPIMPFKDLPMSYSTQSLKRRKCIQVYFLREHILKTSYPH